MVFVYGKLLDVIVTGHGNNGIIIQTLFYYSLFKIFFRMIDDKRCFDEDKELLNKLR